MILGYTRSTFPLTIDQSFSWQRKVNKGLFMKGSVQAAPRSECVKCSAKKFKQRENELLGINIPQCEKCGGLPNSFRVKKVVPDETGKGKPKDYYEDYSGNRFDSPIKAIAFLSDINNELGSGSYRPELHLFGSAKKLKFNNFVQEYLSYLKERTELPDIHEEYLTPGSERNSINFTKYLLKEFKETNIRDLNAFRIKEYYLSWKDRLRTRNLVLGELKTMLNWAHREKGYLERVPVFPKMKRARQLRTDEIPSVENQARIILNIKIEAYRVAYIVGAVFAKRPCEVRAWKVKDVDLFSMTLTTRRRFSKGKKGLGETLVSGRKSIKETEELGVIEDSLNEYLVSLLAPFVNDRDPEEFLFLNRCGRHLKQSCFGDAWKDSAKELGLSRYKSYAGIKHSTLTDVLERSGGDFGATKGFSNHTNVITLERYAKPSAKSRSKFVNSERFSNDG
jgi:integrase